MRFHPPSSHSALPGALVLAALVLIQSGCAPRSQPGSLASASRRSALAAQAPSSQPPAGPDVSLIRQHGTPLARWVSGLIEEAKAGRLVRRGERMDQDAIRTLDPEWSDTTNPIMNARKEEFRAAHLRILGKPFDPFPKQDLVQFWSVRGEVPPAFDGLRPRVGFITTYSIGETTSTTITMRWLCPSDQVVATIDRLDAELSSFSAGAGWHVSTRQANSAMLDQGRANLPAQTREWMDFENGFNGPPITTSRAHAWQVGNAFQSVAVALGGRERSLLPDTGCIALVFTATVPCVEGPAPVSAAPTAVTPEPVTPVADPVPGPKAPVPAKPAPVPGREEL